MIDVFTRIFSDKLQYLEPFVCKKKQTRLV